MDVHKEVFLKADKVVVDDWDQCNREKKLITHVDTLALRRVFQILIARHPSLRTTFSIRSGNPVQEIHSDQDLYFEELDAST